MPAATEDKDELSDEEGEEEDPFEVAEEYAAQIVSHSVLAWELQLASAPPADGALFGEEQNQTPDPTTEAAFPTGAATRYH